MTIRQRLALLVLLGLGLGLAVQAHPGGRDADGCHTCRTNCTQHGLADGEYHCHGNEASQTEEAPPPLATPELVEPEPGPEILELAYTGGYILWLDCQRRGAIKFQYNAQRDQGDFPRSSRFFLDPDVPERCQQTSAASYRRGEGETPTYDRGHLVPANHLDHSEEAIRQSNAMPNILPQVSQMNRGAWLHTEEIIECYRDIDELLVIGGVLWGDDLTDDYFLDSHGIATPEAFWKVIIRGDGRSIGWLIPNRPEATRSNVDQYLIRLRELEALTGETFPVDDFRKDEIPASSWVLLIGCDKG